jgi:hypothetical protein
MMIAGGFIGAELGAPDPVDETAAPLPPPQPISATRHAAIAAIVWLALNHRFIFSPV